MARDRERGEWPVIVRPDSGLTNPISRPPRCRAAGLRELDFRSAPGYSLFCDGNGCFRVWDRRSETERKNISYQ